MRVWAVSVLRTYPACGLLPHPQWGFMALTQATLLICLYLLKIKENHGFIIQTKWVCLHSRQASLNRCIPGLHHTYLICYSEAINCSPRVQTIAEAERYVLNTKCYLSEHRFHYCLPLMLTSRHLILMTRPENSMQLCLDSCLNVCLSLTFITRIRCTVLDCAVILDHTEECMSLCALSCLSLTPSSETIWSVWLQLHHLVRVKTA